MRNFFRKRRNPQFGEAGSGENVRPDLDPRVTPFGPRLVSDLGDPDDEDPGLGDYRGGDQPAHQPRSQSGYEDDQPRAPRHAPSVQAPSVQSGAVQDDRGFMMRSATDLLHARKGDDPQARKGAERSRKTDDEDLELPRFSLPVAGTLRSRATGNLPGLTPELNKALREAFTPTRPKQEVNSLFVGRLNTLRRIIAAIEEERAHVVLFGDRGRGKTSLANAIQQIASQAGYFTLKLTCSAELSFEDVFRNFLRRIPGTFYRSEVDNPFAARRTMSSFDELLPEGSFSVTELNDVLAEIQGAHVLLVLDEYDRVTSEDLRNKLAELIKNLTDSSIPVTVFIVGVAESLDQLLGKHPSIQRSLVAVHLPLMSDKEIDRIIVAGSESAGVGFSDEVRDLIVMLAKGLPYYAQLLSLHAARSAVSRGATQVGDSDLVYAVARCVQEAERGIVEAYNKALGPDRKASFADVLYVAAQCRSDDYGSFHPGDMAQVPVRVDGEPLPLLSLQYPLSRLSDDERGGVLQRIVEPGGFRYRFRNQMMRQYVLMRQARDRGLI
jgi:hypothetical protein